MPANDVEVLVVGGGAAGIAAAHRLWTAKVPCLLVEARPRLGGRAFTIVDKAGFALDLGCGWLHSADRNPWVAIAEQQGATIDKSVPPWQRRSLEVGFPRADQDDFQRAFHSFFERVSKAADETQDVAASSLLEPGNRWNGLISALGTYISGGELECVSVKDFDRYEDSGVNWRVVTGLGAVIRQHAAGVPVELDCPVHRVDHSGKRLRIETAKGVFTADRAIVSVPTTILAAEEITFTPALPQKTQAALGLPLGLNDKLFLSLDHAEEFGQDVRLFGHTDRAATGVYQFRPFGRPLIEVYFGGRLPKELESEGDDGFFRFAVSELTHLFGNDFAKRVELNRIHRWGVDPFARGSYSFALPGRADDRAVLAEAVDNRLFFAGEACSKHDFSTAHGALHTGVAAAKAVIAARQIKSPPIKLQALMTGHASRRGILRGAVRAAALGAMTFNRIGPASAREQSAPRADMTSKIDGLLRAAVDAKDLPGVVVMAASDSGLIYEGAFGTRRLPDGDAMTRDTIFRVASMIKPITTVAALQLVERGKLSLNAPVPPIEPPLGAPQVLDGFDEEGRPKLRPAKRPILLRELLTHTSGFAYRLWDAKALRYVQALTRIPAKERRNAPAKPLMFDPGERWQYGGGIDWVGRLIEVVSGEPLDVYFRKQIFDPLGMHDTAFAISPAQQAREASGHRRMPDGSLVAEPHERQIARRPFSGGGGIYSSAPDYLTFVHMLLRGGASDGARILRPETVALMGRNQIGTLDAGRLRTTEPQLCNDVDFFPGIILKWGFGHMINMQPVPERRSAGSLTWGGLFNTYYWIDPQKRIVAVFMTQIVPFADPSALAVYGAFERAIYASI